MLKTTSLLLLVAAAVIQVNLSQAQTSFSSTGEFDISSCPINFYGRKYNLLQVYFNATLAGVCFKDDSGVTEDCLSMEVYLTADHLKLKVDTSSGTPPASLPNVKQNLTCQIFIEQYQSSNAFIKYRLQSYGSQTVVQYIPFYIFTAPQVRFNVTVEGSNVLAVESNKTGALVEVFFDLSGCRIAEPPYGVLDGFTGPLEGTCFNRTCDAVSGQYTYDSGCRNGELCINTCIPVCSVTGFAVVDFNGGVHSIPDRCVYSLVKPQGSSEFEVLAGFRERRRLDVPFLDYLEISVHNSSVIIHLEQGGKVLVDGNNVSLNSTPQAFNGVELSIDQSAVSARLSFANITVSFDGTTAHVSGEGLAAAHEGLCGNPIDPNQTANLSAANTSSDNAAGCGIRHNDTADPTINCDKATTHCKLMNHTAFAGCHNFIDPQSYITACTEALCNYPAVDRLHCQFLESYAEACSLSDVTLGNWRSTTNCPVALSSCLTHHCSTHEFCGESSTGVACYCRAEFASKYQSSNTLGEPAVCTPDSATLSLAACLLEIKNIDYTLLSLNDINCTGHLNQESHMVEFSFNSSNSCGSEFTTHDGQVIFNNTLSTRNNSNEIISRHGPVSVNFSCLYTAPQAQSASFRIIDGSVVQQIQSGLLNYTLVMNAYSNSALTNVLEANSKVFLNQKVWVELKAVGLHGTLVALVTDSCWATNQPPPNATLKYDLIINGCPNPNDETIVSQGNGEGMSTVFSFNMFEFTGGSNSIYLHCKLELCSKQSNSCAQSCAAGNRQRRSSGSSSELENPALITMVWSN